MRQYLGLNMIEGIGVGLSVGISEGFGLGLGVGLRDMVGLGVGGGVEITPWLNSSVNPNNVTKPNKAKK